MPLKNRNVGILAACVIILGVVFYGYWSFVYTPIDRTIKDQQTEVNDLTGKLNAAKARASQLNKIQAEMATLQVDVAQLEKQLPKNRELPSLLRVVTHRAEAAGVAMGTVAPQKAVAKGLYDELPFNITMSSSFHSLGHFLTAMGQGERLFAARNLALTAATVKSDTSKTVNATFVLVAFKYHE